MEKHYIEWLFPGFLVSETVAREVPSRTRPAKVPERAYAYRFYDQSEVELDGEILKGKSKNHSCWIFMDAELYTLEQVERLPGKNDILISNMKCNNWDTVVKTKFGQFMQLHDGDRVE